MNTSESMSESNIIDKLPNEMIMKIFGHLDFRSLDNAVLTCKRWKERIEELCPWPLKIDLRFDSMTKSMEFSQTTKRKFNKLALRTCGTTNDIRKNVVEMIKIHGSEIVELFLYQCVWNIEFFVTIMKHLPKLNHLIVMCTEFEATVEAVELPELKRLQTVQLIRLYGSGCNQFIECLTKSKLETIQIRACDISPKSVKQLLKSQKFLKTLAVKYQQYEGYNYRKIFETLDESFPFKLTNLSLRFKFHPFIEYIDRTNYSKFMETQSQTLKSLESRGEFSNRYYFKTVLSKFSNLKSLRISISDLPMYPPFYEQLQAKNVTTLILEDWKRRFHLRKRCPTFFKNFIRCLPNVTDLTLDGECGQKAMTFLSNNLKHVEKLSIRDIVDYNKKYIAVQFPKMHTLNIKQFTLDSLWYDFVKNNTQLTNLTVNIIRNDSTVHPINHIKKFIDSLEPLRLQRLSIGKRYPTIPIMQSTKSIFYELPFRDENLFNKWLDQEFWTEEKYYGSLCDKWIYDYHNQYDNQYEYTGNCLENVFAVLEKDLNQYEKMAVTGDTEIYIL